MRSAKDSVLSKREDAPSVSPSQTRPLALTLPGRASPLELIRIVADATNATGVGAILSYNAEPRR